MMAPAVSPPDSSVSAAGSTPGMAATVPTTTAPTTVPTTESATGSPSVVSLLPLYTPAEAARLLAVPESWLRRRVTARTVPYTLLGKHLRFSHADLVAIATAGARPAGPAAPLAAAAPLRAPARRDTGG